MSDCNSCSKRCFICDKLFSPGEVKHPFITTFTVAIVEEGEEEHTFHHFVECSDCAEYTVEIIFPADTN